MLLKCTNQALILAAQQPCLRLITTIPHRLASTGMVGGGEGGPDKLDTHVKHGEEEHGKQHADEELKMEKQTDFYRPGSDSFAYENPWPKLNKGRLDWMFNDGWRRPLADDQGAWTRREWFWLAASTKSEHKDWEKFHYYMFYMSTLLGVWFMMYMYFMTTDFPRLHEWSYREAHLEIARRTRAGLPLISPDLVERSRVEASLPSEEELRDFDIVI